MTDGGGDTGRLDLLGGGGVVGLDEGLGDDFGAEDAGRRGGEVVGNVVGLVVDVVVRSWLRLLEGLGGGGTLVVLLSTSIDAVGWSWVLMSWGLLLLLILSVGMFRLFEKGGVEEEGSNGMLVDGDVACGMPGWTDGVVC